MRVLVQFRTSPEVHAATLRGEAMPSFAATAEAPIPGLVIDPAFNPVQVPTPQAVEPGASPYLYSPAVSFSLAPEEATYLVRGAVPDDPQGQRAALAEATARPEVVGVFADPAIATCLVCPGDPAVGTDQDVAELLGVTALADAGMDGYRVPVAVVDTGINLAHLEGKGRDPKFSARRSWAPAGVATRPGKHPVGHGTMCAYDIGIAAPKATLVDLAVLLSQTPGETAMSGLLSDAVLAFSRLLGIVSGMAAARRALVVNNSWGMFDPAWDFPVGHPGNYSDNPAHPFNVIVASLEAAGADILFAAGNCGRDCPDGRCRFGSTRPICGPTPTRACCRWPGSTPASAGSATPPRARAASTRPSPTCPPTPTSAGRVCTRPTAAPRPPARSPPAWSPRSASTTRPRSCPRPSSGPCSPRPPRTSAAPASTTTSAGASSTEGPWWPPWPGSSAPDAGPLGDMAKVMVTLRLDPSQATLPEVVGLLGLEPEEVDPGFGVVPISPAEHRYTILVDEAAATRIADAPQVEGVFGNPRIEGFGPEPGPDPAG